MANLTKHSVAYLKVGNSQVSVMTRSEVKHFALHDKNIPQILKAAEELTSAKGLNKMTYSVLAMGVVPKFLEKIKRAAKRQKILFTIVEADLIPGQFRYRKGLGIDRRLNLFELRARGIKDFVVIDLGTAITIDFVANRWHLGGWILPGPRLQWEALSEKTAALPLVTKFSSTSSRNSGRSAPWRSHLRSQSLGNSTQACIQKGVAHSIHALVEYALHMHPQKSRAQLFITGGWSEELRFRSARRFRHLALWGLKRFNEEGGVIGLESAGVRRARARA